MTLPAPLRHLALLLREEARKGYQNSAVIGGLDALLERARAVAAPSEALPPPPARPYADLSPEERRGWTEQVAAWLAAGGNGAAPTAAARPHPSPSPVAALVAPSSEGKGPLPERSAAASNKQAVRTERDRRPEGRLEVPVPEAPFRAPVSPLDQNQRPIPQKGTGPSSPAPRARRAAAAPALTPDSPASALPGVGAATAERLARLNVATVGDLLYLFPRRHLDYSRRVQAARLQPDTVQTVIGVLWEAAERPIGKRPSTEAVIGDETGNVRALWFNQPHVARSLAGKVQSRIALSGKVTLYRGRLMFESPDYELLDDDDEQLIHTGRLVPVYPRTEGLTARTVRRAVTLALDACAAAVPDALPEEVRARRRLLPLSKALRGYHYPESAEALELARRRLAFDELLLVQLGVEQRRQTRRGEPGRAIPVEPAVLDGFLAALPFALTGAQRSALDDILADLQRPQPANRLVQGDVGSGKTVVAAAAMILAAAAGMQAAIMAPTELLAEQHYRSLTGLLERGGPARVDGYLPPYLEGRGRPVQVGLLTGSRTAREKADLRERIAGGQIDLVVGTHALIQESVAFANLGLVVVDEQHRFGVAQRWSLRQKGYHPHVLVMTATPIPRTLALSLYGDLDLSSITELPPGRQPIITQAVEPPGRARAYRFVQDQVAEGRQAFVVCPLIDESPALEARAAVVEYERLSAEVFPHLRLGLLHGRMAPAEKDDVMRRFAGCELDILVSTSVVEVGIDVPNATVMMIEGADRFGLSQLHQFRGRVGRGQHQSYCLLLAENPSEEARERLQLMVETQDGFRLAEADLRLRGPGEFFGTRQTGLPALHLARLSDRDLWEAARQEAETLLKADPDLTLPHHAALRRNFQKAWQPGAGDIS